MMPLKYSSEFVFIGKGDESFLENYSYELNDDADNKAGRVYMALEILNNLAEAPDIGEAIFSNFRQKFYEDVNAEPYERFEEALKEANKVIETLKEEKVSRFIGNLNVAVAAVVDNVLYVAVTGDAEVYLVRKKFVSIVSEGLAEENAKASFMNIANGDLEPHDNVVLSSSRLLRYITKGELGKIFSENGAISDSLDELKDFIMTEILGRSAIIGLKMDAQEEEESVSEEDGGTFEPKQSIFSTISTFASGALNFLGGLKNKLSGILPEKFASKLPDWIADKIPEKIKPQQKTYIHIPREISKEKMLAIIATLLIVLVGGVFWMRSSSGQRKVLQESEVKLNRVRDLVNEASTVGQFDKAKAAQLLAEGEKDALQVLSSRYARNESIKILDDIKLQRDTLDDVKRVTPILLADLSEKRQNVNALGLLNLKDSIYAFEYNALYEMVLDKLQQPLTISDLESVIKGASSADLNALFFLTRTGKMIEYNNARFSLIGTKDGIWKKGVDLKTYGERIYILDPERNQIWRYNFKKDTFDVGTEYNQDADIKKGVSFAIDSSVYVLNSDGTVIQLYQGKKQNYPLKKAPLVPLAASDRLRIFTAPSLNHIFILDPDNQRVVLFRKDTQNGGAQYQTQYVFNKVGNLRDFMVVDNRLYVMDDKKVYFVNLSGL